ncbi:hypothetical protein JTE90_018063 [Oedothorax gibbosus]|uniref:Uncharacterized protein n=1 Tax=Oedothorax gibbosus TaxID=931172 RepID=A0AAV6TFB6_9ARAC|nr:hypothetical protein JTE90_018063 [Oedothorax gibbosus]
MGQSVLRDREKSVPKRDVCRNANTCSCLSRCRPKGNGVNIPQPGHGDRSFGTKCGNATELGDVDGGPGEELSFLCKSSCPWNRLVRR